MILVDANLLIYAHVETSPEHGAARRWLEEKLNAPAAVGLPWPSLLAFIRLVTNPRVFEHPETIAGAWRQVEEWLARKPAWIPLPTDQHQGILGSLLTHVSGRSNLVADAHLAALAIEHGLVLCSADRGYARFPNLRWENPLAGLS